MLLAWNCFPSSFLCTQMKKNKWKSIRILLQNFIAAAKCFLFFAFFGFCLPWTSLASRSVSFNERRDRWVHSFSSTFSSSPSLRLFIYIFNLFTEPRTFLCLCVWVDRGCEEISRGFFFNDKILKETREAKKSFEIRLERVHSASYFHIFLCTMLNGGWKCAGIKIKIPFIRAIHLNDFYFQHVNILKSGFLDFQTSVSPLRQNLQGLLELLKTFNFLVHLLKFIL